MSIKKFGGKTITIRRLSKSDLKIVKKFQDFINSLVREDAKISMNKEIDLKGERKFLEDTLKNELAKKSVHIVAETDNKIVGTAAVRQKTGRSNHVGSFGITIRDGYRGIGLGKYMMQEVIKIARKELKPKMKIVTLEVFTNNTPGINLYKKLGFKIVAKIPKSLQFKGKLVAEYIMQKSI